MAEEGFTVGPNGSPVDLALLLLEDQGLVPTERIGFEEASLRFRWDMLLSGIVKQFSEDVDELMAAARVELGWNRYWLEHHPEEQVADHYCEKFLRLAEVMQRTP